MYCFEYEVSSPKRQTDTTEVNLLVCFLLVDRLLLKVKDNLLVCDWNSRCVTWNRLVTCMTIYLVRFWRLIYLSYLPKNSIVSNTITQRTAP